MATISFPARSRLDMISYGDAPAVLAVGEDEACLGRLDRAAAAAGCRVIERMTLADATPDRLAAGSTPCLVAAQTPGDALDALLDMLEADAAARPAIVVSPLSLIDAIEARISHPNIVHLSDPHEIELTAQIASSARRAPSVLADVGRRNGIGVLQQLSEDAARLASILAALSEDEPAQRAPLSGPGAPQGHAVVDAAFVRTIIRARRLRDQYLPADAFADPAFDMLLDLFASRLEGQRVAVSSLCIAAAVPATTALRWIRALTERGLFQRVADPQDGRRVYIELSQEAEQAMGAYLDAVQRLGITTL